MYLLPGTRDHQMPGATTVSDESLVQTAQNGGHWAYVELCRRYRKSIFCIVQRITKNSHDTEDVLQDAWMRGFVHIRTFDGRAAFSTWLTRIAINSALMMLRKRRWHLEASLDDQEDSDVRGSLEIVEPSDGPEDTLLLRKEKGCCFGFGKRLTVCHRVCAALPSFVSRRMDLLKKWLPSRASPFRRPKSRSNEGKTRTP